MKKTILKKEASFRFRRFCRKAYAAFRSLHHEVTIGRVESYIADRQMKKSACSVALCLPLFMAGAAMAQSDDDFDGLTLPVVTITASGDTSTSSEGASSVITRSVISHLTATTVGELIESLPGVELRSRGSGDVHGDITMRGGTFDQMVVLLNGIPVSDPQTGHYNLDIPIDLTQVERIELLGAGALVRYGVSAFCGGINIVTGQRVANSQRVALSAGSYGTANVAASVDRKWGSWHLAAAGAYNRSDGYRRNTDYSNGSALLQAQRNDAAGAWQMQLGAQTKNYGSNAFYSLKYPDQYDATRTLSAAIQRRQQIGVWQGDIAAYTRLHRDRFELFRTGYVEAPSWYGGHNHHLSSSSGLRLRLSCPWLWGRSTFGVEYHRDGIVSNVLGDSLSHAIRVPFESGDNYYTVGKARHRGSLFADHSVALSQWDLAASAILHTNSMSGFGYGYALSVRWHTTDFFSLAASFARSDRQPTFTDLYYHSATQVSDPTLRSEVSHTADLSARLERGAWRADADIYVRRGSNIIDWVRQPDESVWYSVNQAQVNALGGDASLVYTAEGFLRRAEAAYSFCTMQQRADDYVSQYALDYLRHKAAMRLSFCPVGNLLFKLSAAYQQRTGHYSDLSGNLCDYEPVVLVDAAVSYRLGHFTLSADAHNLLNREYYDYGGIPQPRTTFMVGVTYE